LREKRENGVDRFSRCERKGVDALSLPIFTRISISCNDDEEHMKVLPPLDTLLKAKVMLFKARSFEYNWPKSTAEWQGFQDLLGDEDVEMEYTNPHQGRTIREQIGLDRHESTKFS
jgi:hypothetical protein